MITNKLTADNFKVFYQLGLGVGLGLFGAFQFFTGFGVLGFVALGLGGIFAFESIKKIKTTDIAPSPTIPQIIPSEQVSTPTSAPNSPKEPKRRTKLKNTPSEPSKSEANSGQQEIPALNLGSLFLPLGSKGSLRRNTHRHRLSQQPLKDDILSAREMTPAELSELMQESARDKSSARGPKKQ